MSADLRVPADNQVMHPQTLPRYRRGTTWAAVMLVLAVLSLLVAQVARADEDDDSIAVALGVPTECIAATYSDDDPTWAAVAFAGDEEGCEQYGDDIALLTQEEDGWVLVHRQSVATRYASCPVPDVPDEIAVELDFCLDDGDEADDPVEKEPTPPAPPPVRRCSGPAMRVRSGALTTTVTKLQAGTGAANVSRPSCTTARGVVRAVAARRGQARARCGTSCVVRVGTTRWTCRVAKKRIRCEVKNGRYVTARAVDVRRS